MTERICLGCDQPFEPKRSNQKYHDGACKQKGHRRRHDQMVGTVERKDAKLDGIDVVNRKWVIRDLARHGARKDAPVPPPVRGVMGADAGSTPLDAEQDPTSFAANRWRKKLRACRRSGASKPAPRSFGRWEDATVIERVRRVIPTEELETELLDVVVNSYELGTIRESTMRSSTLAFLLLGDKAPRDLPSEDPRLLGIKWHSIWLASLPPTVRRVYARRRQEPQAWAKVVIELVRTTHKIASVLARREMQLAWNELSKTPLEALLSSDRREMLTIPKDERLALDAVRLAELSSEFAGRMEELAQIAQRLGARFPSNDAIQLAVARFLEQSQSVTRH